MKQRVLVGCEFTGRVRQAMRDLGIDAWSCDLLPAEDNSPYHIQGDLLNVIHDGWTMAVLHPPCTYTSGAGYRWFKVQPDRMEKARAGYEFFMKCINAPIPRVAVENTRGLLWQWYRKPDQIVHPYYFGDPYTKATCFWLKGLPKLWYQPTDTLFGKQTVCDDYFVNWSKKGNHGHNGKSRSKTFPGMAQAIAEQWGSLPVMYRPTLWAVNAVLSSKKTEAERAPIQRELF